MPEFLTLLPPRQALELLLQALPPAQLKQENLPITGVLNRVTAADIRASEPLPSFARSTVDGYAVIAADTYGASDSLPAYLSVVAEIPMGTAALTPLARGQAAPLSTGGMLPPGANAVVMLEHTQIPSPGELEVLRPAAIGENIIAAGEDVRQGDVILPAGRLIRPQEVGGLAALGIQNIYVTCPPSVGILSSGDEVVSPDTRPAPGQVRDVNSFALSALVEAQGAKAVRLGIVPDKASEFQQAAQEGLSQNEILVITAGSSASARDLTSSVINNLGEPGVIVHGVNVRPGKPTILAVCGGKPVIGLPGNPVSALVIAQLFLVPMIERAQGLPIRRPRKTFKARLAVNLASQAGREDWIPAIITQSKEGFIADPIFYKSNLIFSLVRADGLIHIPSDKTGIAAGEIIDVY